MKLKLKHNIGSLYIFLRCHGFNPFVPGNYYYISINKNNYNFRFTKEGFEEDILRNYILDYYNHSINIDILPLKNIILISL